jgi:2-polyprenyl-6-methoxyphenol hydroxylase-like FAD-dependent oxidoreductase
MKVAIIGGGIAGLSLASALERSGAAVELIEREPRWTAQGAAIGLRPLAVKALRRLGLLESVVANGRILDVISVLSARGELVRERQLSGEGDITVTIHRRVLQELLAGQLQRTQVQMGSWPITVDWSATSIGVNLSNGQRLDCDVLVGADGVHSWVRREWFPDATLRPVGQQYWRFCVEGEHVDRWTLVVEPERFVVLQPLRGTTYCAANVSGSRLLATDADATALLRRTFADYQSPTADVLASLTPSTDIHFGAIEEVILETWNVGPIALIGDAAHAISPIMALGGGLAIEDAVILAEELNATPTPDQALAAFTARRRPRVELARSLANERVTSFRGGSDDFADRDLQRRAARLLEEP